MEDSTKAVSLARRLTRLVVCVLAVLAFIFVLGPWIAALPAVRPLAELIERRGINAGGYFYTDVEEFSDAEVHIRR